MTPDESRPSCAPWPLYRILAAALLFLLLAAGAAVVFLPIGWELNRLVVRLYYAAMQSLGIDWFPLEGYEVLLNVLLFATPTFFATIVWPSVRLWQWAVVGLVITTSVESIQFLFLPRQASFRDILANVLGGVIGAWLGSLAAPPARSRTNAGRLRT